MRISPSSVVASRAALFSSEYGVLSWARHSLPVAYFAGLIIWQAFDTDWRDLPAVGLSALTAAYLALIIGAYLRRGPARPLQRGDWFAQVIAVLGANLLISLALLPTQYPNLETAALVTSFVGLTLSFWAAWYLGMCFSIVPEARRLVQTGPYRWIRHPLYLAGFVIGVGLLGVKLSPPALGLFLAFVGTQALRMAYEEEVLTEALPEYRSYRRCTWALLPFVY